MTIEYPYTFLDRENNETIAAIVFLDRNRIHYDTRDSSSWKHPSRHNPWDIVEWNGRPDTGLSRVLEATWSTATQEELFEVFRQDSKAAFNLMRKYISNVGKCLEAAPDFGDHLVNGMDANEFIHWDTCGPACPWQSSLFTKKGTSDVQDFMELAGLDVTL